VPNTAPTTAVGEVAGSLAGVLVAPLAVAAGVLRTAPAPVFYLGAGALAVAGVVEWPVVALVAAGTWLAGQRAKPVPTTAPTSTATRTGPNRKG